MSILDEILARKREEVAAARIAAPEAMLDEKAAAMRPSLSLLSALSHRDGPMRVIAEIKRASPSAGSIAPDADIAAQASAYADGGAAGISVLTDGHGFGGSLDDLRAVRTQLPLTPLLRKDFVIDEYQLVETRAAGADAVLLIVAALGEARLRSLHAAARALTLDVLVEVHDEREAEVAAAIEGVAMIGINSRNLATFDVDLGVVERVAPVIPTEIAVVAESGITSAEDARRISDAGVPNLLVGEALMRSGDPAKFLSKLTAVR